MTYGNWSLFGHLLYFHAFKTLLLKAIHFHGHTHVQIISLNK